LLGLNSKTNRKVIFNILKEQQVKNKEKISAKSLYALANKNTIEWSGQ